MGLSWERQKREEAEAKLATLRATNARLREALSRLEIDANRVLDVYPKESRGTYFEDLQRSVAAARRALEEG